MRTRRKTGRVVGALLIALFLVGSLVSLAGAETYRLTIGAGASADGAIWVGQMRDFFAPEVSKRVAAQTKHKIKWVHAYAGAVAKIGGVLEAVQDGIMDVGLVLPLFEPSKLFLHNFGFYIPFSSPDNMLAAKTGLALYEKFPFLKDTLLKKYNQKFLGLGTAPNYGLVTTFAWEKTAELKDHKLGGGGPNLPWIEAVGAIPVQMDFTTAYMSMQTGVFQGVICPVDAALGFKFVEVAPNFTFTDFGAKCLGILTINKSRWDKLPKDVQKIILEVGQEYTFQTAKAGMARVAKASGIVKKKGVRLYQLPKSQKTVWAEKLKGWPAQKAKEANRKGLPGTAVLNAYMTEMEKLGYEFPYHYVIK